ncbi:MAG: sensor histidine kinase [gamma proteobacterium symbiont of Taylorina sp.]|nr:sensor histidine kinase [gamma proteobacterium symbiont of Taylorina sp.]
MKNSILLFLFLLIPVCLLVWFAFKAQSNEQLAAQQQYQNLAHSQLRLIDEKISLYFQQLGNVLITNKAQLQPASNEQLKQLTNKIRQFLQYSPYILNIYIADEEKQILYPSLTQNLSAKESEFLKDIQVISNNSSLFYKQKEISQTADNRYAAVSQKLFSMSRSKQQAEIQDQGWITWYQQRNLQHIFWFRDTQNRLYLLSLDRIKILSELIALLPDKNPSSRSHNASLQETSIRLSNSNNELIYEWGNYPHTDKQSIDLMLSYPLSSWKLSWYAKNLSENNFQQKWSLLIIALFASLLMLIIMFVFYREYNREIRGAQQRVNFVSQVSHELKTPLTNIRMYAELLETNIESESLTGISQMSSQELSKSQHFLSVILNESQRLSRLIENVLSFAKVQKESFIINKSEAIADESINNVLLSFKPVFKQKKLSVQFSANAAKPVNIDSQLLEQILNNLLSNVEKYAAHGKKIEINSSQTAQRIKIEIRDYGPGITKTEQEKIFNAFYRSNTKITEGVSGTGIGLTISQQLAKLHGGKLSYKNVSKGACFIIELEV